MHYRLESIPSEILDEVILYKHSIKKMQKKKKKNSEALCLDISTEKQTREQGEITSYVESG